MDPITEIWVKRSETGSKERSDLLAQIDRKSRLQLSSCHAGASAQGAYGDSDVEFFVTVPASHKDTCLLLLLRERFSNLSEFKQWLSGRGVPFDVDMW